MTKEIKHEKSSGNVFKDLGLNNPEERLIKAEIAKMIYEIIKSKKLNQKEAALLLGIDQPKISAITNGRLEGFTIDRLFKFLIALEQDIEITVTDRATAVRRYAHKIKVAKNQRKGQTQKGFDN